MKEWLSEIPTQDGPYWVRSAGIEPELVWFSWEFVEHVGLREGTLVRDLLRRKNLEWLAIDIPEPYEIEMGLPFLKKGDWESLKLEPGKNYAIEVDDDKRPNAASLRALKEVEEWNLKTFESLKAFRKWMRDL